jgi:uncharacterized membrane protein HdeD (DUF308 family)
MFDEVSRRWWTVEARGAVALGIGIALFFARMDTLGLLVSLFGAFAVADGTLMFGTGLVAGRIPLLLEATVGIATGAFAFLYPTAARFWFVPLMVMWALVTSGFELAAIMHLRRFTHRGMRLAGQLLGCLGIVLVLSGIGFGLRPGAGALTGPAGAYAALSGLLLFAFALNIRTWGGTSAVGRESYPGSKPEHRQSRGADGMPPTQEFRP